MAPVNPHAETYKGSTTFSGPIKAGLRWLDVPNYDRETVPGTIAVKDLPNAGFVVFSQSAAVEQSGNDTISNIMLPPGTMILSIQAIVTTAYTGTKKDMWLYVDPGGVGEGSSSVTEYTEADRVSLAAVGVYNLGPDDGAPSVWRNISDPTYVNAAEPGVSVDVRTSNTNTGDGRAIVTINYIPEFNFPLA